jgi:putative hydrolase of the HAD superfamily
MPVRIVGLDADDTLWHSEKIFRLTQDRLNDLLSPYADAEALEARLAETERRNLAVFGYGAKGFTLSMLETALEVSGRQVSTDVIAEIIAAGRELLTHPVEPLPGVLEALEALSSEHRLVLITKGDLFHQESKLAASGLGDFFSGVEIVSEKSAGTYRSVFARHGEGAEHAVMAGNSVRSDVLPALEAGSYAALIPYPIVWQNEAADAPVANPRFRELASLAELPAWLETIR